MMSPADDSEDPQKESLNTNQPDMSNPQYSSNSNSISSPRNDNTVTLRIHETGGSKPTSETEALVRVSLSDTVAALKNAVVTACRGASCSNDNNNYYVRLIAAGRLLAPDHAVLDQFALQQPPSSHALAEPQPVVVHAVIVDGSRGQKGAQAALQQGHILSKRAMRATGVNEWGWAVRRTPEDETEEYDEEDDNEVDHLIFGSAEDNDSSAVVLDLEAGQFNARRRGFPGGGGAAGRLPLGFDRLRVTSGLGRADVMALRIYFNSHIDRWLQQQEQEQQRNGVPPPRYAQERDALRRRRLQEEAWMEAQGPASEFRLNLNLHSTATTAPAVAMMSNPTALRLPDGNILRSSTSASIGTDRDFFWGFLLGFFVGFLMLIWIWLPTVPHKQKLGILTGYSFHLGLGLLKGGSSPNDDDAIVVLD